MDHLNQGGNLNATSSAQTIDVGQDLFALTDATEDRTVRTRIEYEVAF